jgi:hypothetical protein
MPPLWPNALAQELSPKQENFLALLLVSGRIEWQSAEMSGASLAIAVREVPDPAEGLAPLSRLTLFL